MLKNFCKSLKAGLMMVFIFSSMLAMASHYSGGEITYEYIGPNQYLVTLQVYRDCNGIAVGTTHVVNYSSATCGVNASITLNLQSTTDITPLCPSAASACGGGGGSIGIESLVFTGILNLPPGCTDWILSTTACCRNSQITNLSGASSQDFYIEAHLNNTASLQNTSPSFTSVPQFFACVGQTINFQQLAYDADGDVLSYSLVNALQSNGTSVGYAGGFSGGNPFTVPLTLNPLTGEIIFTPNVPQIAVVAVLIEEYRNGVLIGSIMRDIQFIIQPCTNTIPTLSGIDGVPGVFSVTICAGQSICFDVFGTDPDAGQVVSLTYDNTIPGAVFTTSGGATNPIGTFCWSTTMNDAGTYSFTLTSVDNACPLYGQTSRVYTIIVLPNPNAPVNAGPDQSICAGGIANLLATTTASNALSYAWTPSSTLSSPNTAATQATPGSTTSYTVTLTYTDGCSSQDAVTVTVLADPIIDVFPGTMIACGGGSALLTATTDQSGMNFQWFDAGMTSLGAGTVAGSQSSISVTVPGAAGSYVYTCIVTNPITGCSSQATATLVVGTPPVLPSCVNIYASTTGNVAAAGTQADPTTLAEALNRAACNNAIIKIATGTYNIDNALTIGSFLTLEGGFIQGSAWLKTSSPGATTINRTTLNPEGAVNGQRIVAFYANGSTGFRFQDLTVTTANANLPGMSTYGVHLTACSNYEFVRTQILPGSGAAGAAGTIGLAGTNGANGVMGNSGTCDGGSCTFSSGDAGAAGGNGGGGAGGAAPGTGGTATNGVQNNGTAGTAAALFRNGGAGGGAGAGGDECSTNNAGNGAAGGTSACAAAGAGGIRGGQGDPGGDGTNGANGGVGTVGTAGAVGPVGTVAGGFWVPGTLGSAGTDGCGGAGGGGGGGGGRQTCTFCDNGPGNGGSGGGGGGQGGTGGSGGRGGGSSYGLFLFANGASGVVSQSFISAGAAGPGGAGGTGGPGGAGGVGAARRTTCSSEIGEGGAGGNGGAGGAGGVGGAGSPGVSIQVYLASGTALATDVHTFNLAGQPLITVSNINCTFTDVNYSSAAPAAWDFDVLTNYALPATAGAVSPATTQYSTIDRYTVAMGANSYEGFHNIAFSGSILPIITSTATQIGIDTFIVCQGDYTSFEVAEYADLYNWNFNGAIPNPGNVSVVSSQFNVVGFFPITASIVTDCCGLTPEDTVYLYVVGSPAVTGSGNAAICAGESTVLTINGLLATDSVVWSPVSNSVTVSPSSISVNPTVTTTYLANVYAPINAGNGVVISCPTTLSFTVTVNPIPQVTMSSTDVVCANDGTATATVSNPGTFNYAWSNGGTTSTISGLPVGNYNVTVTDVLTGCQVTDDVNVFPSPGAPVIYLVSLVGTCEDVNEGEVTVNTIGGTGPMTYSWSNGGSGTTQTGLATGSYTVSVTDNFGCTSSVPFDIPEYEAPHLDADVNGPICSGDSAVFELIGHDGAILTYNFGGANSTLLFVEDTMYLTFYNVTSDLTMNLVTIENAECTVLLDSMMTVSVYQPTTVLLAGNGPICIGNDAVFTLTGTPNAVVTYILGGTPYTVTLTGGTAQVTIPGPLVNQTIVLDSITDGFCPLDIDTTATIIVNPVPTSTENLSACENTSYTYPDGFTETITANTSHVSNLLTALGCDSVVTTNITMLPVYNYAVAVDVCENESYTYPDGTSATISASTSYTSSLLTVAGCDSIVISNVTMLPIYTVTEVYSICSGEDYTFPDGTVHTSILVDESYTSLFVGANGCDSSIITNLTVNPLPIVDAGADQTVCDGESLTLTATNPSGAGLSWDNGVLDGVAFVPTTSLMYYVTATSAFACVSIDSVMVNVHPVFNSTVAVDVCENETYTYPDGSSTVITASTSYTSNLLTQTNCDSIIVTNVTMLPISITPVDTAICAGEDYVFPDGTVHSDIQLNESYTSVFVSANGCDSSIVTNITVNPLPVIDAGADQVVCAGTSITLTAVNPTGAALVWSGGVVDGSAFVPSASATYTVTATSAEGCVITDDMDVIVNPNPVALFTADTLIGCTPLNVEFTNLSSGSIVSCVWDFGNGTVFNGCADISTIYPDAGLYDVSLTVIDGNGCTSILTYTDYIAVYETPIAGFTAFPMDLDILHPETSFTNISVNATDYIWDFGDGSMNSTETNPDHTFPNEGSGDFIVELIAMNNGCSDTATYVFSVEDVLIYYVPNTFTPDGDQVNQTFKPIFSSGYDPYDYQLLIFNRWGEIVFESHNTEIGWDGTYNGTLAQDGSYTWKLEFKERSGDVRHIDVGHLTLMR